VPFLEEIRDHPVLLPLPSRPTSITYLFSTVHFPSTFRPPTVHLPFTYRPPTVHLPSTNRPPTVHQPSTNRPPTVHLPSIPSIPPSILPSYRPPTVHIPSTYRTTGGWTVFIKLKGAIFRRNSIFNPGLMIKFLSFS
jgi:hypothetical protein